MSKKGNEIQLPTLVKMKILVVGDQGTGKTCLLQKYLNPDQQLQKTEPTIGIEYYSQRLDVEGAATYAHFWELSGNDLYLEVRNEFYPEVNGIVLVYDQSSKTSFEHLNNWIEEGNKYSADWKTAILVGTKGDSSSEVSPDDAGSWAKKHQMESFVTSAKSGKGIQDAFSCILSKIKKKLG